MTGDSCQCEPNFPPQLTNSSLRFRPLSNPSAGSRRRPAPAPGGTRGLGLPPVQGPAHSTEQAAGRPGAAAADLGGGGGAAAPLLPLFLLQVLAPLCRDIETELRLSVHQAAGLQLDDRNPFRKPPPLLQPWLLLPPLPLLSSRLHLRHRVQAYLANTFYNLTTVSLANWRTYGAMRQLALSRCLVLLLMVELLLLLLLLLLFPQTRSAHCARPPATPDPGAGAGRAGDDEEHPHLHCRV